MPELKEVFDLTTKQIEPDVDAWRQQEVRQRNHATGRRVGAIVVAAAVAIGGLASLIWVWAAMESDATREHAVSVGAFPLSGSVRPGTYRTNSFDPPLMLAVPDGWEVDPSAADIEGRLLLGRFLPGPPGSETVFGLFDLDQVALFDPTDGSRLPPQDDFATFLWALPGVRVLDTQQITVRGAQDATAIDFAWTGELNPLIGLGRGDAFLLAAGGPHHIVVVDTSGGQLLILWGDGRGMSTDPDVRAAAEELLGTLRVS